MTAPRPSGWAAGVYRHGDFEVSTEHARLDHAVIQAALADTYWARDVDPKQVMESIANALPFGLYHMAAGAECGQLVGFARLVTDKTRFAWISDVFVRDGYKGQGCGTLLMRALLSYPPLENVYNWTLATKDAHGFYEQFGFRRATGTDATMQLRRPKNPAA